MSISYSKLIQGCVQVPPPSTSNVYPPPVGYQTRTPVWQYRCPDFQTIQDGLLTSLIVNKKLAVICIHSCLSYQEHGSITRCSNVDETRWSYSKRNTVFPLPTDERCERCHATGPHLVRRRFNDQHVPLWTNEWALIVRVYARHPQTPWVLEPHPESACTTKPVANLDLNRGCHMPETWRISPVRAVKGSSTSSSNFDV